jgi:hypothetical protein
MNLFNIVIILVYGIFCNSVCAKNQVNYADGFRMVKGELPVHLSNPDLLQNSSFAENLKHWTPFNLSKSLSGISTAKLDAQPVLSIDSQYGITGIVSDPIEISPDAKYLLTGVYHTSNAKFGSFAMIEIIPDITVEAYCKSLESSTLQFSTFGRRELYNRKDGEWIRRTTEFTPEPREKRVRVAIVQFGTPAMVNYSSLYFGLAGGETRNFDSDQYTYSLDTVIPPDQLSSRLNARLNSTAEIKMTDYPRIFIDGQPYPDLIYFGDAFSPSRSKLQTFQQAGIKISIISVSKNVWRAKDDYDFATMDKLIMDAVSRNPEGYFIARIDVTPYKNWCKDYPDDVSFDTSGKIDVSRHGFIGPPSYWSQAYRNQVLNYLRLAVEHMKKQPYYRAIIGFFPSGNEDGQFFYQSAKGALQDGSGEASAETFREWLKTQYKTEDRLKSAWRDANVNFSNAKSPLTGKKIKQGFLDPRTQQAKIDFVRFLNESMGEFANQMCSTVKQAADKKVITAMWWGRGAALAVYPHFAQTRVIFPSPAMDLMGAQAGYYGERENGSSGFIPFVFDSARAHGKTMMLEADFRTWISPMKSLLHDHNVARYWNLYDYRNAVLREFGKMISVGGGLWWYDMAAGWFKSTEIMEVNKKINEIGSFLTNKATAFTPSEIVVVADEQNYYGTTEQSGVWNGPNYMTIRTNQRALLRSGIKYDFYYWDDIVKKNMTNYKVYIMSNLFNLSPEGRAFIDKNLKKGGKIIVWLYAPGYVTSGGFSDKSLSEITGITIQQKDNASKSAKFADAKENQLLAGISSGNAGIGFDMPYERFVVNDPAATALAFYTCDNQVAAAAKKYPEWTSIFIGVPSGLTPQFVQNIARAGNAHIYNTAGDMFMHHRDDLICLHGVEGLENVIRLPYKADITDLYSGEVISKNNNQFKLKLAPGETRLLYINKRPSVQLSEDAR